MAILKNNWLRTGSLIALMLAFFVTANASENNEEKKAEKNKPEKAEKKLAAVWFIFNSPLNPGDSGYEAALQDEDNYTPTHTSTPPTVCQNGEEKVCAVKVSPSSGDQDLPDPEELAALIPEMTSENPDTDIVRLKPNDISF